MSDSIVHQLEEVGWGCWREEEEQEWLRNAIKSLCEIHDEILARKVRGRTGVESLWLIDLAERIGTKTT